MDFFVVRPANDRRPADRRPTVRPVEKVYSILSPEAKQNRNAHMVHNKRYGSMDLLLEQLLELLLELLLVLLLYVFIM